MDFLSTLYQLIFMPLQIIFEVIYYWVFKLIGNPGISIIALSFIVNLLVLPLYNRADAMQEAERDIELKLSKGVEHIKKTFKGDEQLMMLQTYYRQNNYSPLDSIKGSISLLLEIPFFVAAYQFLSHLDLLNGASLGPIKDLGVPDGLLTIVGHTINVLPFIMTVVNLASAYVFTKRLTRKTKIQLYGMACFFMIFLYNSPAGLVCYWTLNNIFNFVKTIICKLSNTDKGINIAMLVCSIVVAVYGVVTSTNYKDVIHFSLLALVLNWRFINHQFQQRFSRKRSSLRIKPQVKTFVMGAMFLALLIGAVIPSVVIEASPQEFLVNDLSFNPLWYLVSSVAIAIGTFIIWGGVFYGLASPKYRVSIERTIWMFCGAAIVNYMFFGKKLGILSATLKFEEGLRFSSSERAINAVVFLALLVVMYYFWRKFHKYAYDVLVVGVIALFAMVGINVFSINNNLDDVFSSNEFAVEKAQPKTLNIQTSEYADGKKIFTLGKSGKNVVVIMLDMAVGAYVPYILYENKEVYRQFDGFIYYNNVITHGSNTNFGTPGLFGGYEYIPVEMNKRNDMLLKDKHNEALKVLPHIFYSNDYIVTVCDPPYTNYKWVTDFSIYNDYPKINKYKTIGKYFKDSKDERIEINMNLRNFYLFGLMKSFPLGLQKYLYDNGRYNVLCKGKTNHKISSIYTATNIDQRFMKNYSVLLKLSDLTKIVDDTNTFLMLVNEITHAPSLLQLPEYEPKEKVDNRNLIDYYAIKGIDGSQIKMSNRSQVSYYHSNMAAFIQLGKWFDYLRSNGIYDNTRIILVSDHARSLKNFKKLTLDYGKDKENNVEWYFPLLMVKDFYATGFNISKEFMTNADVPTLALKGIVDNPVNPFTGNEINSLYKKNEKQYIFVSKHWNPDKNNGKVFKADRWYSVHTNIWDRKNWKLEKEKAILPY